MPTSLFDPMPTVTVTYTTGAQEVLFWFYPDELSFQAEEFIGLTRDEAIALKGKKDRRYLRT